MKKSETNKKELFETLPDILNVHQVKSALGIGRVGVYKLLQSNEIACFKIGNTYKVPKSSLIAYINQSCNCEKGGEKL